MKLSWRIFCTAYAVVMLTVGVGGLALTELTASSLVDSRVDGVLTANSHAAILLLALSERTIGTQNITQLESQITDMTRLDPDDRLRIYAVGEDSEDVLIDSLSVSQQRHIFLNDMQQGRRIRVVCLVEMNGERYAVETTADLTGVFSQRSEMFSLYRLTVLGAALLSGILLLAFSWYLARPLHRLSDAANRIASGDYQRRIESRRGGEEISRLSADFNRMAEAVERRIEVLNDEVERRESFVANFTHELKTPMTSIIGYADLLRSYELGSTERRQAAEAVYREGRRLEKLSMELLRLVVLKEDSIELTTVRTDELFRELGTALHFLPQKYGVSIRLRGAPAEIKAERTLLLSLLYNLTDNACKASPRGETVTLSGALTKEGYLFSVIDHGCGISEENIGRITEPFFMEDKSRSRSQGGAGLGLSLGRRIAELHGTQLQFESRKGQGTTVRLLLRPAAESSERKE